MNYLDDSDIDSSVGSSDDSIVENGDDSSNTNRNDELMASIDSIQQEINNDNIPPPHIYNSIRSAMGTAILNDKSNKYKKYDGKLGKKVSFQFVLLFPSKSNIYSHRFL